MARRRPSALAVPWPFNRSVPSACWLPSKLASPPNTRAVAPTTLKPFCVKSMRAFAPLSSGVSGVMRTSLPVNCKLPRAVAVFIRFSGSPRLSVRSALPLPVATSSALPVQPAMGVVATTCSISASGPCAVASSESTLSVSRLRMASCRPRTSSPASCALPLRISSVLRSSTSSALAPVNAGHGDGAAGAGRLGTNAKPTPSSLAVMRNSLSFALRALLNGKSHRSPLTRKVALGSLPPSTARPTYWRASFGRPCGR